MPKHQDIKKPNELTNEYIRLLHESKGYHLGYFQIVEFHQKRQKIFSTHISDGFFKCKVIFRDNASKQIENGQIKLFSILFGPIANQGDRIFMVLDQLKAWDYPRTVGVIRSWKLESPNVYIHGSNILTWGDELVGKKQVFVNANDSDSDGTASCCASEIVFKIRTNSLIKEAATNQHQNLGMKVSELNGGYSFGSCELNQTASSTDKYAEQTQSLKHSGKKKQVVETTPKKQEERSGRKLLIVKESQAENIESHDGKVVTEIQSVEKSKRIYQSSKINDDKEVFHSATKVTTSSQKPRNPNHLTQSENKNLNCRKSTQKRDDEDDDIFFMARAEINKIKQMKTQSMLSSLAADMDNHIFSARKTTHLGSNRKIVSLESSKQINHLNSIFLDLMESEDYDASDLLRCPLKNAGESVQKTGVVQVQKTGVQKTGTFQEDGNQIKYSELVGAFSQKVKNSWQNKWIKCIVHCIKDISDSNGPRILAIAQQFVNAGLEGGHIFNILISNPHQSQFGLQEGVYQIMLKGFSIESDAHDHLHGNAFLRVKLSDLKFQYVSGLLAEVSDDHFGFLPIHRIIQVDEGMSINTVGVLLQYKNFNNKKKGGWTNVFTIIDPFSASCIQFTVFASLKIIPEPGSPIVIFNAAVNVYRANKCLGVNTKTIYLMGESIPKSIQLRVTQLRRIEKWVESGNSVADLVGQNQEYIEIPTLLNLQSCGHTYVQTPLVRITKVSHNFQIYFCDKCNRRLFGIIPLPSGSVHCPSCGRREKPFRELQLSLQVSDNTHCCFMEFNHYDSLSWIGEEGERMAYFVEEVMHRWVRMRVHSNGRYRAVINRMELVDEAEVGRQKMMQVMRLIQYL